MTSKSRVSRRIFTVAICVTVLIGVAITILSQSSIPDILKQIEKANEMPDWTQVDNFTDTFKLWLDEYVADAASTGSLLEDDSQELRRQIIETVSMEILEGAQSKAEILDLEIIDDAMSQLMRGQANLFSADNSPCDVCRGVKWLSQAALNGNPEAYLSLASLYFKGHGVEPNIELGCYAIVRHSQIYETGLLEWMNDVTRQMAEDTEGKKQLLGEPHPCDEILPTGFSPAIEQELEADLLKNLDAQPCPGLFCRILPDDELSVEPPTEE